MKRGTPQHPKTLMLAAELNLPLYAAVGILESLWHWTAQFAKRGDVGRYPNTVIARQIGWDQDPDALIAALVKARWLDEHPTHRLIIHDWHEHAEDAVHISNARRAETFASGHLPQMNRLPKEERARLMAEYERRAKVGGTVANDSNAIHRASMHTRNAQETHCLSLSHGLSHGQGPEEEDSPEPPQAAASGAAPAGGDRGRTKVGSGKQQADADTSPVVLTFPVVGKGPKEWHLRQSKLCEYAETFTGVDVMDDARKARQWLVDNPTKRKTTSGMPRFLYRWFSGTQNAGGTNGNGQPPRGGKPAARGRPEQLSL